MEKTVVQIFEDIENAQGRLEKEEILRQNRHNELLKEAFCAALDPFAVYYINKFKVSKIVLNELEPNDTRMTDFLHFVLIQLSERKVTGNSAKKLVENSFASMDAFEKKWCQRIILKNLRCGVQASTVNKVWPELIREFKVQLANTLESSHDPLEGIKILGKVSYPVRGEPKLDGLRCLCVKQNGEVTLYKRSGHVIDTLPTIKSLIENAPFDNVVLDGEGMASNFDASVSIMMSNKTLKDDSDLVYHVFDAMPLSEWLEQKSTMTLLQRLTFTEDLVNKINNKNVVQVNGQIIHNETDLLTFYVRCLELEYEGVMLKEINSTYVFDRSDSILKFKPSATQEGMIVGWTQGRKGTKREGLFNGFSVLLSNGIMTRVGSGINDALRAESQLVGPDSYVGKIAECSYQPDPSIKTGLTKDGKMRFPRFERFRDQSDVDQKIIEVGLSYLEK